MQFALNELTPALLDPGRIELGAGDLGAQCGQVALEHQLFDTHRLQQRIKERWLVGDEAMPQTVWCGGKPHNAQRRVDCLEISQELAIATLFLVIDKVALVNDHQIKVAQQVGLGSHGLDASKRNRLANVSLADASAVYAHRCSRPMQTHLLGVLLNQFLDMGEHQHPSLRPVLQCVLA